MWRFLAVIIAPLIANSIPVTDVSPKSFTINMDLPAHLRLQPLCDEYRQYVKQIYEGIVTVLPSDALSALQDIMLQWFLRNAVEPYRSEIEYISECSALPLGGVVTLNLLYDMTASCTSIIARNADHQLYHARNLDYGRIPILRNCTYIAHYVNNAGETQFVGIGFFGYIGLWTGVRHDAFAISGDERDQGSIVANIKGIHDDYWPSGWLIRDTLMRQHSFEEALHRLNDTMIMAPVYYILSGTTGTEGVVITRDQLSSYRVWWLSVDNYLQWYLVETNYDWWTPAPTQDDRRDASITAMDSMSQSNLNVMNVYQQVMSADLVLNNGTIFTTVMSAQNESVFYTRLRFPDIDV